MCLTMRTHIYHSLLTATVLILVSVLSLGAQNESTFEQFKKQREARLSGFEDQRAKEFEEFKARYYSAFEQFKKSYQRSLEDEEAAVDLMASDDGIAIDPVQMAPAPPVVASTVSEQKKILRESIRLIADMKPEDLVPVLSDAEDTVVRMQMAAEVMETIVAGMNADAQENEAPAAPVSMTVVLEPYDPAYFSSLPDVNELVKAGENADTLSDNVYDPDHLSVIASWKVNEDGEVSTLVGEEEADAPGDLSVPHGTPTEYVRISSPFGSRIHPITHKRHGHKGIDLAAPRNTPIYATADGVVTFSGRNGGYGNFIKLNHRNGYKTAYAHLNSRAVREGSTVKKGDLIGYVGSTGASTGNHLHYEVYYQDKLINPATTL